MEVRKLDLLSRAGHSKGKKRKMEVTQSQRGNVRLERNEKNQNTPQPGSQSTALS